MNRQSSRSLILALALVTLALVVLALPGSVRADGTPDGALDTSFGNGGKAQADFAGASGASANDLLAMPNGDFLAVGSTLNANGQPDDFALARYIADGEIDGTFGTDDRVITAFPYESAGLNAAALQSDGKIVAAGEAGDDLALVRYKPSGKLDADFGAGGKVLLRLDQRQSQAQAVAVQTDGKIVVAGQATAQDCPTYYSCRSYGDILLARYDSDGSPDSAFGAAGVITTSVAPTGTVYPLNQANALLLLDDGKILLAGDWSDSSGAGYLFARFNSDGSLDSSFGAGGKIRGQMGFNVTLTKLAVQGTKLLAAGWSSGYKSTTTQDFFLGRFNMDGTPDTTFGTDGTGYTTLDFQGQDDIASDLLVDSAGKIVLVGRSRPLTGGDQAYWSAALARFNSDGTLDTSFAPDSGRVLSRFGGPNEKDEWASAVALKPDATLVVAGAGGGPSFVLAGYNDDGSIDTDFGNTYYQTGNTLTPFNGTDSVDQAAAFTMQPDGKLIVAGTSMRADSDFALARFNADGNPDPGFGNGGKVTSNLNYSFDPVSNDEVHALGVQSSGKIVVAGSIRSIFGPYNTFTLVRYNSDGSYDGKFYQISSFPVITGHSSLARALLVQPDDKIVVGGQYGEYSDYYGSLLVRYNADGGQDDLFAVGGEKVGGTNGETISALALQSDGKIIVGGTDIVDGATGFSLYRLNADGSDDLSFRYNSNRYISFGGRAAVTSIVVQPDAKILVAVSLGYRDETALLRLNPDGSFDSSFGDDGAVAINPAANTTYVTSMALQPDGKIMAGGLTWYDGTGSFLSRYLSDGQLDPDFAPTGGEFSRDDSIAGLALLPNGEILAGGTTYAHEVAGDFFVARYHNRPNFSDVASNDYFYEAVIDLAQRGVLSGYGDGAFRPYNTTTRSQLAKIAVLAEGWSLLNPAAPTFSDVPPGSTFYQYVETAAAHGIISGYDTDGGREFRPGNNVTRGQLAKIVVLAAGWTLLDPATPTFVDVATGDTFYQFVETAAAHGIISGYDVSDGREFRPGNSATRGQVAKIVYLATQPAGSAADKTAADTGKKPSK